MQEGRDIIHEEDIRQSGNLSKGIDGDGSGHIIRRVLGVVRIEIPIAYLIGNEGFLCSLIKCRNYMNVVALGIHYFHQQ